MADLRHREVDAALRPGGEPPEGLIGRRLCRIAVAVYRGAVDADRRKEPLERRSWVVPGDDLSHLASARWLKERGHTARAVLSVNSLHSLALAVANGIGLGILPCYLADGDRRLVRISEPIEELASDLWFLTHAELRHTARMRVLSEVLAKALKAQKSLFEGRKAHSHKRAFTLQTSNP